MGMKVIKLIIIIIFLNVFQNGFVLYNFFSKLAAFVCGKGFLQISLYLFSNLNSLKQVYLRNFFFAASDQCRSMSMTHKYRKIFIVLL